MSNFIPDYWRDKLADQFASDGGTVQSDGGSKVADSHTVIAKPHDAVFSPKTLWEFMAEAHRTTRRAQHVAPKYYIPPELAKVKFWADLVASGHAVVTQPLITGREATMVILDDVAAIDLGTDDVPSKPQPEGKAFTMSQTGAIHPPPAEFTAEEIQQDPILQYFHYSHLSPVLKEQAEPFARHARHIIDTVPRSAERSAGLRKLLEAKDCIVRSML